MDDKEKYIRLYHKMVSIQDCIGTLKDSINSFKTELSSDFIVDDKVIYSDTISNCQDIISDFKESVKHVRNDIKNCMKG